MYSHCGIRPIASKLPSPIDLSAQNQMLLRKLQKKVHPTRSTQSETEGCAACAVVNVDADKLETIQVPVECTVLRAPPFTAEVTPTPACPRELIDVVQRVSSTKRDDYPPTLYVLNAAAITKPHAVEHLAADLTGYQVDIAVITETHLKKKHDDKNFLVRGYSLFRRDRVGRRSGGVAIYVNDRLLSNIRTYPGDSSQV